MFVCVCVSAYVCHGDVYVVGIIFLVASLLT